jgi:hypothetical protein
MIAAADDDELPEEKPEIAALLQTVAALRADNLAKSRQIEELQAHDGELQPLKQLCNGDSRLYENALRASRRPSKLLKTIKFDGRVMSKPAWMERWKALTGRGGA